MDNYLARPSEFEAHKKSLYAQYDTMIYRNCGKSGLKLPLIALGLWQNFGGVDSYEDESSSARSKNPA